MNNESLDLIINRFNSIDSSLHQINDNQKLFTEIQQNMNEDILVIKEDQKAIKEEQKAIREEQKAIREEQKAIKEEQKTIREDQKAIRDEIELIKVDINGIHKTIWWIQDDIQTIYTLQKEANKILSRHDNLLNTHTKKLNILMNLAENNKDEHMEFDKRTSRLEALN